ncbi:glutamyl-trna amidotransferase [Diplodia corticola]|uniref:Glutamyl-trna amidotransferase n=1 Tax=Diplodia corticola TaxID=236234 RepID=A0A1J9QQA8_9PEZI|nr:glutamyl-trna amidotransferase [Diplodia corticola]OJD30648.1 glutamyl-trna amidotransferase [Diplodia corticola]
MDDARFVAVFADGNSCAEEPHVEQVKIVHVGDAYFMAIPAGTVIVSLTKYFNRMLLLILLQDLTYGELRYVEPSFQQSSLEKLVPEHHHGETSDSGKASLDNQFRSHATPKYFTVLDAGDQHRLSAHWIAEQTRAYQACDTFQHAFLHGIVLTTSNAEPAKIGEQAKMVLRKTGVKWISWLTRSKDSRLTFRPGPHYTNGACFYELHRLHDDTHDCFITAITRRSPKLPFRPTSYPSFSRPSGPAVAVPSRLKPHGTSHASLAGMRVAIKDNFDVAGVRTSLCNRAYDALYAPAPTTAACVQTLIDKGAAIVGKTKLSSFAATEEPIECIEWPAPWNPRADGHQSPAGSSSGSAAAVAAYDWLDVAVGSDTSGSGRRPAHWNGVVAMRPTHGVLSAHGLLPSFHLFDVPTFFGRDLVLCRRFAEAWYGDGLPSVGCELPVEIVVPIDYLATIRNPYQSRLIEEFLADMENFFGVQAKRVKLDKLWVETRPEEAENQKLSDYMEAACRDSFWYDDFHNTDEFRSRYKRKFGSNPYVSPPVQWQWSLASEITKADRDDAVNRLRVYRKWFTEKVMKPEDRNTIIVLPIEDISPRYRDEPPSRKFYPTGVPMLFLSPITGGPELTIPIGQVPYVSKVTGREELLPMGISLMASPGYDLVLMDLMLKCLEHANRPTRVRTGRHMFFGGNSFAV